jgi:PAS domain S-box-containing protein
MSERAAIDFPVNILLVDDQPANLLALEAVLGDLGQNLVKVPSGVDALRALLEKDFAVILLDVQMQGMDGLETARLIRERDRSRRTPIIFLTAHESDAYFYVTSAYALGAVDYLVKPLVPAVLRSKVMVFVELFQHKEQVNRQSERLRAEAESNLRLMIESVKDYAIFSIDLHGRVTTWNTGAERMFGYTESEILRQPFAIVFTPEDRAGGVPEHELSNAVETGRAEDERWHLRKDGSRFFVSGMVTPIYDEEKRLRGFTKVARDVTDRKRTEELLQAQSEALKEIDRRKDEFLAMLSHELRNPLASISHAVQLLRMPGAPAEHAEWSKEVIDRQVKHLARIIDDLLDVSRIAHGKIVLRKERIDASAVIASAVDAVRPLIETKQQLDVSFTPGTLWCEADPTRLEQILINLLSNATHYTDAGGRIGLTARHEGEHVIFKVKDTGIGIPPEKLPEIFELFVQGDRSSARSEGGLGIGLTLVKRIAEMHGGSVTAFSPGPGKGSEFTVTLPAIPQPPAAPSPVAVQGRGRRTRILIVDDNVDLVRGLARLLRLSGHDLRTAYNGPEAITEALAFRPEYILLDIGLPGMDGYQVATRLRAEGLSDAMIIAISGYGQEEDRRRSREAGFNRHLVKPIDYNTLTTLISQPVP